MGKLTIQEVAKILTEKNGLEPREASRFAAEMFSVILQRLEEGDTVKVKGLGTFKIINVEARESVSVRTGERVVIDSHAKVTFTPDTIMRELVNKPFSQFETVVLNDGVEFDDINDEVTEETAEEPIIEEPVVEETQLVGVPVIEETPAVEEPVVEEQPVVEETPAVDEPVVEKPVAEESVAEEPVAEEQPAELIDFYEEEEQEEERHWGRWLLGGLAVLVLMIGAAYGGYEYGLQQQVVVMTDTLVVRDTVYMADIQNEAQDSTVVEETAEESIMDEMISAPMAKKGAQAEVQPKPEPQAKPTSQVKNEPAAEQLDQWSAKDERVRLGAYRIVGLLREVKVLEGQTFYSICRAHLGPDMQCYVEVYNNLPRNPQIKTGQVLKIPKLEPRKRRK
jgi:nucleoid DNA-binding protein